MGDNMTFNFIEEWSQMLGGCNWYTFHPLSVEFEWDEIMGGVEATVIVVGLGFRFRWNYTETETAREIARRCEDVRNGRAMAKPLFGEDDPN